MDKTVCELFAGVGGFRVGLERASKDWKTVWFSQWEPGKKRQDAHDCYVHHFGDLPDINGEYTTGIDVALVDKRTIPDFNLLVGGFPCQDYSVAATLAASKGIQGKKGVLWWQIRDTIIAKRPAFCLFENVDRLLKSPAKQRGRDFAIMLACMAEQGYSVEWRVVNAAQYGAAQRRRRTFIYAYRNDTKYAESVKNDEAEKVIGESGLFAKAFPIQTEFNLKTVELPHDIVTISDEFSFLFERSGYMHDWKVYTTPVVEIEEAPITLSQILQSNVDEQFYITDESMPKWEFLKGAKHLQRTAANGHEYTFSEGAIAFPDPSDRPSRTMLTSESTINRSTHVVQDPGNGRLRLLTPIEAERLQGFDDDWTNTGMSKRFRYFCMGNALVVPMITRMAKVLEPIMDME